jgi:hypothetical protein
MVLGHPAHFRPIEDGYAIGVVEDGPTPCGFALTGYGISVADFVTLAEGLTKEDGVHTSDPSQSPDDARRDHVIPALAALPAANRSRWQAVIHSAEGTWVLSRPAVAMSEANGCALGDRAGVYGVDWICTSEYGEVLLLDDADRIVRAYPMPGVPPKWFEVTDNAVYAGAVGDGALPNSTVVRIDKKTMTAQVIVFPNPDGGRTPPLPGWRTATSKSSLSTLVEVGAAQPPRTAVHSAIGPVGVDLEGIASLFANG